MKMTIILKPNDYYIKDINDNTRLLIELFYDPVINVNVNAIFCQDFPS